MLKVESLNIIYGEIRRHVPDMVRLNIYESDQRIRLFHLKFLTAEIISRVK